MLSSFAKLNLIQFFAAINENFYKLLAAFFLIHKLGVKETNSIMATIGALFILPFLLFSNLGGIFADRYSKNQIVFVTRLLELICLCSALLLFGFDVTSSAYVILFLMASLSAIFGPSKYGIIPELIDPSRILYGNSIIAAYTFLGVIIGTSLASFMVWVTHSHYVLALLSGVFFALVGMILSLFLPKTPIKNATKPFPIFIYAEVFDSLKQMKTIPSLLTATLAFSYLLFIGAFIQLNIIPYTVHVLGFSIIVGGYFFLISAFGLGLGAYFTDRICRSVIRLRMIPFSGIGISIVLVLMKWVIFPWWMVLIWLFLLGFLGGMFLVPPQAFILSASPEADRGRNFATANFLSFAFALIASGTLYLLNLVIGFSPDTSFIVVGIINFLVMLMFLKKTSVSHANPQI